MRLHNIIPVGIATLTLLVLAAFGSLARSGAAQLVGPGRQLPERTEHFVLRLPAVVTDEGEAEALPLAFAEWRRRRADWCN